MRMMAVPHSLMTLPSYTITELEESSNYTITVIAMNAIEMANSTNVTGFTQESGTVTSLFTLVYRHFFDLPCISVYLLRLLLPLL